MPTHPHRQVAAHDQSVTHRYVMHYPAHAPREGDPHYRAFELYRRHHRQGAVCYVGERAGHDQCAGDLELHHSVLEFAVVNAVDAAALHKDFPEVREDATAEEIAQWAESSPGQFRWLCAYHHRGAGGAHTASHADWSAQLYVPHLIS
ncbi:MULTISPECIES: hypothetical protein [Streptomycetaceae]|uniref:Uncharacterized protein n=1 Tax=Streptantibioticus cattleyicolor (strain ATCC 35852 / DSM 46488 / JCM 4925 / NBRC 14057 / NRRL 8057) TaxID=1003195 RepID=F8JS13_STREN|nr:MULTISPECIES: hypothetical protein [Streptomycetaceae]AEW92922.1 hypothetical protein SCATT_05510 [Streptantibioticus cattleyicolor NRRL 8057 = DSM 46488]MYS57671.1 hypothetical protein [Streptomyces sp. SID5468]CCB73282.1 conserved protein of unknown function [Streptantibioticus cattleyicolor NRRL 8057 = DSM 46488]